MILRISLSLPLAVISFLNSQVVTYSNILIGVIIIYLAIMTYFLYHETFMVRFLVISLYIILSVFGELLFTFLISLLEDSLDLGHKISTLNSLERFIYTLVLLVLWGFLYQVLKRALKGKITYIYRYKKLLLAFVIGGGSATVYFQRIYLQNITGNIMLQWTCFLIWCILSVTVAIVYIIYRDNLERANIAEVYKKMTAQNYTNLSTLYKKNSSIYHDLKNHMNILHQYLKNDDSRQALAYIESIVEPIRLLDNTVNTENQILDIILNYKLTEASKYDIQVETDIEKIGKVQIKDDDLCSIVSNIFDNAIEACYLVKRSQKWINVVMKKKNNMLIVKVSNSLAQKPKVFNNLIVTSKEDKNLHGLGLWSIKTIVNQYEGLLDYNYNDNLFEIIVTLNC
ncbi:GHKL domain-containing protein [Anaerocolumna sp. AGMB13025]|uniref:sensor histidine kinase n=1 Tax=Anaerocolumna sp. AGMB13025 TaxID=3039116 RepID=UPI00241F4064|nr:sensor histidine kinase [Anaerocolumna sp. AGMB13025]WFR55610.1 GHKL domain-containing protein [Anaerocolumna sp. AGMB13025]